MRKLLITWLFLCFPIHDLFNAQIFVHVRTHVYTCGRMGPDAWGLNCKGINRWSWFKCVKIAAKGHTSAQPTVRWTRHLSQVHLITHVLMISKCLHDNCCAISTLKRPGVKSYLIGGTDKYRLQYKSDISFSDKNRWIKAKHLMLKRTFLKISLQ